jgi:hypothetical protein
MNALRGIQRGLGHDRAHLGFSHLGFWGWVGREKLSAASTGRDCPAARGSGKLFRDPRATQAAITEGLGRFLTLASTGTVARWKPFSFGS